MYLISICKLIQIFKYKMIIFICKKHTCVRATVLEDTQATLRTGYPVFRTQGSMNSQMSPTMSSPGHSPFNKFKKSDVDIDGALLQQAKKFKN